MVFWVDLVFLVMGSCCSEWSVNTRTWRVLNFPKMRALKVKKRTIHSALFLSKDTTIHYVNLTRGWLHRGSCLLEETIRNLLHLGFCKSQQSCVTCIYLKSLGILDICKDTLMDTPILSKDIYVDISSDLQYCWTPESRITSWNWEI